MRFARTAVMRRRRPSLTPMIDVVFLLLIFFMLAARFTSERSLPVATGTAGEARWQGPPRLVSIAPDGLRLNGRRLPAAELAAALRPLMPEPGAPVVLRATGGATVAHVVAVIDRLRGAGFDNLVLVE